MNIKNKSNTCPVCGQHHIYPPHEVCLACYQKTKQSSGFYEALKEREKLASERRVLHHYLIDDWHKIDINGLGAVQLIGEYILDTIEDDVKHLWHKRRICFMQDMVRELDVKYFAPASREQIDDLRKRLLIFGTEK